MHATRWITFIILFAFGSMSSALTATVREQVEEQIRYLSTQMGHKVAYWWNNLSLAAKAEYAQDKEADYVSDSSKKASSHSNNKPASEKKKFSKEKSRERRQHRHRHHGHHTPNPQHKHRTHTSRPHHYKRPAYIRRSVWHAMHPHFLPIDHPLRAKLDNVFTKNRVTANSQTLTAHGFHGRPGNRAGQFSHATVAYHDDFSGYVLKFFTDDSIYEDWPQLKKRVEGAKSLQLAIDRHGWGKWFKVPRKWIYPMPEFPTPQIIEGVPVKGFIVIAEDMMIYKRRHNYWRWQEQMTPEKLSAYACLVYEEGLLDSTLPFNVPFCCDGKVAFIDLEHNHLWPIPFFKMKTYLHPKLQGFWEQLTSAFPLYPEPKPSPETQEQAPAPA